MYTELERLHKKLAAEVIGKERKNWRITTSSDDTIWGGFMVAFGIIGILSFFFFFFLLLSSEFSAMVLFSVFSLVCATACFVFFKADTKAREKKTPFVVSVKETSPAILIPRYLEQRILDLECELIGKGSQFEKALTRVREIKKRAAAVLSDIETHLRSRPEAEHLKMLVASNQEVFARAKELELKLDEFRAQVERFLADCRKDVSSVREPLGDLDLIRETNELSHDMVMAEDQAWAAAATVVTRLSGLEDKLRRDVLERFGQARILVASEVEVRDSRRNLDSRRYLEIVDKTLADFQPERLRAAAPVLTVVR